MISKNAPISYEFIDPNIRGLVRAMNSLEGVRTMGSCGGHKNPNSIQHPQGKWFITFWVYKAGRKTSLPLIESLVQKYPKGLELAGPYLSGIKAQRGWYSLSGIGKPEWAERHLLQEITCRSS